MGNSDDDGDLLQSAFQRKSVAITPTPATSDEEFNALLRKRQERAETENRVREEEKKKDEIQLIKSVFTEADRALVNKLDHVIEQHDSAYAAFLRQDGPPPPGFFPFDMPEPQPYNDRYLEPLSKEDTKDGSKSFTAQILRGTSSISGANMDFLVWQSVIAESNESSSSYFDVLMCLLTGEMMAFFSSESFLNIGKNSTPSSRIDSSWRLSTTFAEQLFWRSATNSDIFPSNVKRFIRIIEVCARFDLVDSRQQMFLLLMKFACFEKSANTGIQLKCCIRELLSNVPTAVDDFNHDVVKELGDQVTSICLGRFSGAPEKAGTQDDDEIERDMRLHRAVRLSLLLESAGANSVLKSFLMTLILDRIFKQYSNRSLPKPDAQLLHVSSEEWEKTDPRTRTLFSYIRTDVAEVQLLRRDCIQPSHYNRWHSATLLTEIIAGESNASRVTKSYTYKQAKGLIDHVGNTFILAYKTYIDYLRTLRRLLEPYKLDNEPVQKDLSSYLKRRESDDSGSQKS